MGKKHISKRHHPARWWLEPLPLDMRDPDITRAKRSPDHCRPASTAVHACGARPDRAAHGPGIAGEHGVPFLIAGLCPTGNG